MDHNAMLLVLVCLGESGSSKSVDVAKKLGIFKPKYVSMVLLRSSRRGFVSRKPYKEDRESGFVYKLTESGVKWISYKAHEKTKQDHGEQQTESRTIDLPHNAISNIPITQKKDSFSTPHERDKILALLAKAMLTAKRNAEECRSLKSSLRLALLTIAKISDDRDAAALLYFREHEKFAFLKKMEKRTAPSHKVHRISSKDENENEIQILESFNKGLDRGIALGLKIGVEIGMNRQMVQSLATINNVILRRFAAAKSEQGEV